MGPTSCRLRCGLSAGHACDRRQDRARFWYALSLLLDEILQARLDPERPLTAH
jgi:hypothetical protein